MFEYLKQGFQGFWKIVWAIESAMIHGEHPKGIKHIFFEGKITLKALDASWNTAKTVFLNWGRYGPFKTIEKTRKKLVKDAAIRTAIVEELEDFLANADCD